MLKIKDNYINAGFPQNQNMSNPKPHLTMKDNPRARCALVIGDGFTQGFLRYNGIHTEIPCTISDLIPASDQIHYLPTQGDIFDDNVFFTQDKWPQIFKLFEEGLSGVDFFKQVSKQKINPNYQNGLWSLNNNTIGYELRCYLWHYFRSIHKALFEGNHKFNLKYEWYNILKTILEKFFLQVISFNYDFVLPFMIDHTSLLYAPYTFNKRLYGLYQFPVEMSYDYYMNFYDINAIPMIYIHGSWVNQVHFPFPNMIIPPRYIKKYNSDIEIMGNVIDGGSMASIEGFFANPWILEKFIFENNYISTASSKVDLDPKTFPMFADIIPPGFQGKDRYNPYSTATMTSKRILQSAELIIICGLSGREPDTEEVKDLLDSITNKPHVMHIGLEDDKNNPVVEILHTLPDLKYQFFDASTQLTEVGTYINDHFNH